MRSYRIVLIVFAWLIACNLCALSGRHVGVPVAPYVHVCVCVSWPSHNNLSICDVVVGAANEASMEKRAYPHVKHA